MKAAKKVKNKSNLKALKSTPASGTNVFAETFEKQGCANEIPISEIKDIKHAFRAGVKARKGVDF